MVCLEGKMQEIFDQLAETKPVYAMVQAFHRRTCWMRMASTKNYDPHIWFDAGGIWRQVLCRNWDISFHPICSEHSDSLILGTAAYTDTLLALHREISQTPGRSGKHHHHLS